MKLIPDGYSYQEIVNSANFFSRFEYLLNRQQKTKNDACAYLGIYHTSLSVNKSRNELPQLKSIVKLADFVDTTTDYLLAGRMPIEPIDNMEKLVLENLRTSPEFRDEVTALLLKRPDKKK